jgi:hypothetical protein
MEFTSEKKLAAAQTKEGPAAKRRWDETLRGDRPNPGWTTRLGDMGRVLGITAVVVGRIVELLGYRSNTHVTDSAVAAGCGVRRGDGYATHDGWHLERAVAAIRLAADVPGKPEVSDALAAAIASRQARAQVAALAREQESADATRRQEEEALVSLLEVERRALCATDTGMSLLTAVEYITHDPAHRIALYRRCSAVDQCISGMGQNDARFSKITSSVASDLALLERRARAEGFQV